VATLATATLLTGVTGDAGAAPAGAGSGGTVRQVTDSPPEETEANGNGRYGPQVSDDGRYVAFWSYSPSLAPDDDNGLSDVFLHDRKTGKTKLISRTPAGDVANGGSSLPQLSANGKYVAFISDASDLVTMRDVHRSIVYRYSVATGEIELVSRAPSGKIPNRFAVVRGISGSGRYVAFDSPAVNLVADEPDDKIVDVYRYDARTGTTIKVTGTPDGGALNKGSNAAGISNDGRWVLYSTGATNLGPVDTDFDPDAYVYDVATGTTTLISRYPDGSAAGGEPTGISDDGRFVSFTSQADDLVAADTDKDWGAYLLNTTSGKVRLVSRPSAAWPDGVTAFSGGISGDGRYLAFSAFNTPDPFEGEVYRFDRVTGETTQVSVTPDGLQSDGASGAARINHAGNRIAFGSTSTDLVGGADDDTNFDVFVWTRTP
jgi:Tol biopolymer transport system component